MPVVIDSVFVPGTNGVNEVQHLSIGEDGLEDNTFEIAGESVAYQFDESILEVRIQDAMGTAFGSGNTTVELFSGNGGDPPIVFSITFQGSLAGTNVSQIAVTNNTTGAVITTSTATQGSAATAATQTLTFTPPPTSGTWFLQDELMNIDEPPSAVGWDFAGQPDSGTTVGTSNATGSGVSALDYAVGTLVGNSKPVSSTMKKGI